MGERGGVLLVGTYGTHGGGGHLVKPLSPRLLHIQLEEELIKMTWICFEYGMRPTHVVRSNLFRVCVCVCVYIIVCNSKILCLSVKFGTAIRNTCTTMLQFSAVASSSPLSYTSSFSEMMTRNLQMVSLRLAGFCLEEKGMMMSCCC